MVCLLGFIGSTKSIVFLMGNSCVLNIIIIVWIRLWVKVKRVWFCLCTFVLVDDEPIWRLKP